MKRAQIILGRILLPTAALLFGLYLMVMGRDPLGIVVPQEKESGIVVFYGAFFSLLAIWGFVSPLLRAPVYPDDDSDGAS